MNSYLCNLLSRIGFRSKNEGGQALIEMTFILFMLLVLVFGMIDFGRVLLARQIVINVSREAANLASRGTTLPDALSAVTGSAKPLNINENGYIILTLVTRDQSGSATIVDQQAVGNLQATSKIGTGKGSPAALPTDQLPATNMSLVAAEVFYQLTPVTPVGRLLGLDSLPQLYDAAYF
jgi:Flp pilus assembly protein TadG